MPEPTSGTGDSPHDTATDATGAAGVPDELIDYLAARDRDRTKQVNDTLATLTPREKALVREAAVMGYVRGALAAGAPDVMIPPDSYIVADVVLSCLAMPSVYPAIARGGGV